MTLGSAEKMPHLWFQNSLGSLDVWCRCQQHSCLKWKRLECSKSPIWLWKPPKGPLRVVFITKWLPFEKSLCFCCSVKFHRLDGLHANIFRLMVTLHHRPCSALSCHTQYTHTHTHFRENKMKVSCQTSRFRQQLWERNAIAFHSKWKFILKTVIGPLPSDQLCYFSFTISSRISHLLQGNISETQTIVMLLRAAMIQTQQINIPFTSSTVASEITAMKFKIVTWRSCI